MNRILLAGSLLAISLLLSCAEPAANSSAGSANKAARDMVSDNELALAPSGGGGGGGRNEGPEERISLIQTAKAQIDTAPTDRKIIRNGQLELEAASPEETQKRITTIAEKSGGFVVESQQSSSDARTTTRDVVTMTVRVPAEKFNEALDDIRRAASRVVAETVKGEDVTEEFIDIEARLRAKRALEQQFVEIMKRANSVEDALSVQSQLAEVRGEIEKIEGRKRFLENQATLSTIKIRIQTPTVFAANSAGFSYRLAESFGKGFDFALNFVLGLVTLVVGALPFLLLIGLPAFLIVRYVVKRQGKPKSVGDIVRDEVNANK
jgi:hypothetical protein